MRRPIRLSLAKLAALGVLSATIATAAPRLPRSTPEAQGVSSAALLDFITAADEQIDSMNSFMLVRHGHVIAEGWWTPYSADDPHMMYSVTKSFTSTAVGLAIAEGKLSLDDPVLKFFPDDAPANPGEDLKQMRVRDLLIMSTGHHADVLNTPPADATESYAHRFLSWPVDHKPGTHFIYNSPGTNLQAAIVQKVSGESIGDFLRPRLFEPLGIGAPRWNQLQDGSTDGAGGLHLRTEDVACFGQLYLQKGQWDGKQLIPAAWVEAATAKQTSNGSNPTSDWDQGYGYQFWRCRPGFARADGAHGQYCMILPEQDAVVTITSGVRNMQTVMNLVWDKLLPALGAAKLEASAADQERLKQKLASLTIRGPKGEATSPLAAQISGRTYIFPANDRQLGSISLQVVNGQTSLIVRGEGYDEAPILIGHGAWHRGGTTRFGSDFDPRSRVLRDEAVSASGGWETPDTFVAKLCYHETPYTLTVRLQFGGDLVVFNADYNVAFNNGTAFPQLIGRAL